MTNLSYEELYRLAYNIVEKVESMDKLLPGTKIDEIVVLLRNALNQNYSIEYINHEWFVVGKNNEVLGRFDREYHAKQFLKMVESERQ